MRQPSCPYFGECAGCDLQDIEYTNQIKQKQRQLSRQLSIPEESILLMHGPEFGYRNRMEFIFAKDGLGLRAKDNPNQTIRIEECKICAERINELLLGINQFFNSNDNLSTQNKEGAFRYAVIRAVSGSDSVSFVLNECSPGLNLAIEKIKEYSKTSPAQNILITYTNPDDDEQTSGEFFAVKGEPALKESLLGKEFLFSAQGFFQNNTYVAEKLHAYIHGLLKNYGEPATRQAALLDLYAGVGTFGIINSPLFSQVFIVESFPGCTQSAEENLKLNNVKNASISTIEAHSIGRLRINRELYAITDPPRSGMAEKAIEQLKRLKPKAIIYISCNPYQLAKDIPKFKSYTLKSLALFDMFPQTRHMEAVAELRLNTDIIKS